MFPVHFLNNERDGGARYAKQVGYSLVGKSPCLIHRSDCANVLLAENGFVVFASREPCAMTKLIGSVFGPCSPAKIGCAVIEWISVIVGNLMALSRLRSMECRAYDRVYKVMGEVLCFWGRTQADDRIGRCCSEVWLQKPSMMAHVSPSLGEDHSIHRPHPSEIGSLITRMVRHLPPLFVFNRHAADYTSAIHRYASGITVLAMRV